MGLNLADIYTFLSSYKGIPFDVTDKDYLPYKKTQWNNRIDLLTGKETFASLYGKPIVVPAVLGGIKLGSGEPGNINLQPLIVIGCGKNIVSTVIPGGSYSGTVKEFINLADYTLRIFGAVANTNQKEYPTDQVQILKDMWKINEAIPFQCEITDDLFQYVVIRDLQFSELRMSPGMQFYEIQAISDGVQEVEYLKNE